MNWNSHRLLLGLPLLGFMVVLVVLFFVEVDLPLSQRYYDTDAGKWPALWEQPWTFLNLYGEFPGLILGVGSLIVLLLSVGRPALHASRKVCNFFLYALLLGPGLVVNGILKGNWGRPRPNSSQPFDGYYPYERFLRIDPESSGGSFPSGHASMGFFVLSIGLVLLAAGRKKLGYTVTLGSIGLGFFIGFSRVCSGKHFLTDVVTAGFIIWVCTIGVFFAMRMHHSLLPAPAKPRPANTLVRATRLISPFIVFLILALGAVKWPIFRRDIMDLDAPATAAPLHLNLQVQGRVAVSTGPKLQFITITDGHGLANARILTEQSYADGTVTITNRREGLFWKASSILELTLPPDRDYRITMGEEVSSWGARRLKRPADSPHTVEFTNVEED